MKKTLQEEKERFRQIIEQGAGDFGGPEPKAHNRPEGSAPFTGDLDDAIGEFVLNCLESGMKHEEITKMVSDSLNDALEANDDNEGGRLFPQEDDSSPETNPQETDEYHNMYDKNMTQGFVPLHEGKASINLDGKTYKVTVFKKKK